MSCVFLKKTDLMDLFRMVQREEISCARAMELAGDWEVGATAIDFSKPLRTRDGRRARLVETGRFMKEGGYSYPVRAKVQHPNDRSKWVEWNYMANGRWKSNDPLNNNDLVNHCLFDKLRSFLSLDLVR